jgi:hypothetical protein
MGRENRDKLSKVASHGRRCDSVEREAAVTGECTATLAWINEKRSFSKHDCLRRLTVKLTSLNEPRAKSI